MSELAIFFAGFVAGWGVCAIFTQGKISDLYGRIRLLEEKLRHRR